MNGYLGIGTDYHGDCTTLDSHLNKIPAGTDLYFLGDMIGPSYPNLMEEIKNQGNDYYGTYARLVRDLEWKEKFMKYEEDAIHQTDNTLAVLKDHSQTKHVNGILTGNNEEYQPLYWDSFSGTESPTNRFRNSGFDLVSMPKVDFYKNGRIVHDEEDVDTAVLILPYILPLEDYNYIQSALGKKTATRDVMKEALDELKNKIISKIKRANPKYILQLQHEPPTKAIIEELFADPHDPDDMNIYELAMDELSELLEDTGHQTKKYTVMYGHIKRGGSFKTIIYHKGRRIETVHIDEGKEIKLYDTETGETVEPWEIKEGEFEIEVEVGEEEFSEAGKGLEEAVEAEIEAA